MLRNYSSSIDTFAYASCSFGNQFHYDVEPHFSYQTKPNEEWYVGLQANSPSKMLDTGIKGVKFHNESTSLGLSEQLYTAGGSQGYSWVYDELSDTYDPATDFTLL